MSRSASPSKASPRSSPAADDRLGKPLRVRRAAAVVDVRAVGRVEEDGHLGAERAEQLGRDDAGRAVGAVDADPEPGERVAGDLDQVALVCRDRASIGRDRPSSRVHAPGSDLRLVVDEPLEIVLASSSTLRPPTMTFSPLSGAGLWEAETMIAGGSALGRRMDQAGRGDDAEVHHVGAGRCRARRRGRPPASRPTAACRGRGRRSRPAPPNRWPTLGRARAPGRRRCRHPRRRGCRPFRSVAAIYGAGVGVGVAGARIVTGTVAGADVEQLDALRAGRQRRLQVVVARLQPARVEGSASRRRRRGPRAPRRSARA